MPNDQRRAIIFDANGSILSIAMLNTARLAFEQKFAQDAIEIQAPAGFSGGAETLTLLEIPVIELDSMEPSRIVLVGKDGQLADIINIESPKLKDLL